MPSARKNNAVYVNIRRYLFILTAGWTVVFLLLTASDAYRWRNFARELGTNEAYAHINKDAAFRFWGISHSTIYVPTDERTQPDPYLVHIPERDIETPSGIKLTIINPTRIIRQVNEEYSQLYSVPGRVTSKMPLRPENAPDSWEIEALTALEKGGKHYSAFTLIEGKPYLRMMSPMIAQESCIICHTAYTIDEIAGGVAVSVQSVNELNGVLI